MKKDYTFAVARIRAKETALLSAAALEQLQGCRTYEDALRFLADRGWGDPEKKLSAEDMLRTEEEKTWALMRELMGDTSAFDVFRIEDDYQNLKAAVKLVYTGASLEPERLFAPGGMFDPKLLLQAVRERDYSALPEKMAAAAAEAQDTLLRTGDGQLCDVILDRASLEALRAAGDKAEHEVLKNYAALTVAEADVRIALRCGTVGKTLDFVTRALAVCPELDTEALAHASLSGTERIAEYLQTEGNRRAHGALYTSAAAALRESPAAFERWCGDQIMALIRPQKYNPFSIGPLAAYYLARQNEIRCVRVILSGKQNALPDEMIRERLREMYV